MAVVGTRHACSDESASETAQPARAHPIAPSARRRTDLRMFWRNAARGYCAPLRSSQASSGSPVIRS